jgi:hypothetical protein
MGFLTESGDWDEGQNSSSQQSLRWGWKGLAGSYGWPLGLGRCPAIESSIARAFGAGAIHKASIYSYLPVCPSGA